VSPTSKITRAKGLGGMAEVSECLPSKCEALSSNLSTVKKEKKEKTVSHLINILLKSLHSGRWSLKLHFFLI
jgi:hypothetical protein